MPTRVVNVRDGECDVYISRRCGRWPDSVYANPYRAGRELSVGQVLAMYEHLWRQRLAGKRRRYWFGQLRALRGKRLGCWCAPRPCHGDVLVKLLAEFIEVPA